MNIIVRLEREEDYRRVEELTREAFDEPNYPGRDNSNDIDVRLNIGWCMLYVRRMVLRN